MPKNPYIKLNMKDNQRDSILKTGYHSNHSTQTHKYFIYDSESTFFFIPKYKTKI